MSITEEKLDKLLDLLIRAMEAVGDEYYYTQFNNFMGISGTILNKYGVMHQDVFNRFGERGFCYELYHQVRLLIDKKREDGDFFNGYCLQGEIQKINIQEVLDIFRYKRLNGNYTPDFFFHIPNKDANALIVEVKAQPHISADDVVDDLDKLSEYLFKINYKRAVFISINSQIEDIENHIKENRASLSNSFIRKGIDRSQDCQVLIREWPKTEDGIYSKSLFEILNEH